MPAPVLWTLAVLLPFALLAPAAFVAYSAPRSRSPLTRLPLRGVAVLAAGGVALAALMLEPRAAAAVISGIVGLVIGGLAGYRWPAWSSPAATPAPPPRGRLAEAATMIGSLGGEAATVIGGVVVTSGYLVIEAGPRSGQVFELSDETSIGRTGENHVVLPGDGVSRQHARIRLREGAFDFWDLGSTNGTWLLRGEERQRLEGLHTLIEGDRVQLGPFVLRFTRSLG